MEAADLAVALEGDGVVGLEAGKSKHGQVQRYYCECCGFVLLAVCAGQSVSTASRAEACTDEGKEASYVSFEKRAAEEAAAERES